ncbi:PREDICTED: uncharacterized protein LOC109581987 [Amphimedon queenslandica]|uniref:Uncharacterized protein n=1 Tax=Amphimedon queenslandica TaxID=400682 RepID=A0AAN0J5R3_AMPQE|nr:PREDICTED: uncharacterized protein LOC109581987 [Amphimedon queenslandica]|eukprot:XP_019852073.1 PREDICTED: uncharacterized protein LOC109581987 [Amphimedon queenslandica]
MILSDIKMPPVFKKRGKPKERDVTVVGLPAKKKVKIDKDKKRLKPFSCQHITVKERVILNWLVDNDAAERDLRDHKSLIEEEVETRPEKLANRLIDENVDINLVRQFFSNDAWLSVEQLMECMKKSRR